MVGFGRSTGGGRREDKRETAPLVATLTTRLGTHQGILVDVSSTGARVRGDKLPGVDEDLVLGVEKVRAFGTVRWCSAGDCGIEFDAPLGPDEVVSLRREVAKGAGLPPDMKAAMEDWIVGKAR